MVSSTRAGDASAASAARPSPDLRAFHRRDLAADSELRRGRRPVTMRARGGLHAHRPPGRLLRSDAAHLSHGAPPTAKTTTSTRCSSRPPAATTRPGPRRPRSSLRTTWPSAPAACSTWWPRSSARTSWDANMTPPRISTTGSPSPRATASPRRRSSSAGGPSKVQDYRHARPSPARRRDASRHRRRRLRRAGLHRHAPRQHAAGRRRRLPAHQAQGAAGLGRRPCCTPCARRSRNTSSTSTATPATPSTTSTPSRPSTIWVWRSSSSRSAGTTSSTTPSWREGSPRRFAWMNPPATLRWCSRPFASAPCHLRQHQARPRGRLYQLRRHARRLPRRRHSGVDRRHARKLRGSGAVRGAGHAAQLHLSRRFVPIVEVLPAGFGGARLGARARSDLRAGHRWSPRARSRSVSNACPPATPWWCRSSYADAAAGRSRTRWVSRTSSQKISPLAIPATAR